MAARSHRDLIVWQKARALAVSVYRATEQLPDDERYGLRTQMRRAAISVVSNLSEGAGRAGDREFLHYLHIARGSLLELEAQTAVADDLGLLNAKYDVASAIQEVGRLMNGLIRKVRQRADGGRCSG